MRRKPKVTSSTTNESRTAMRRPLRRQAKEMDFRKYRSKHIAMITCLLLACAAVAHADALPDHVTYVGLGDAKGLRATVFGVRPQDMAPLPERVPLDEINIALPWARPIIDDGRRLAASYANFLIVNDAVLMPTYDDPADAIATSVLEKAFPRREIVQVPCRPLIWQNGSLHCLTMQLPEGLI
jgi:hypothetical protein